MLKCVRRLVSVLLAGQPLPKHVAFIPDGNRRFAAQLGLKSIVGHYLGNRKVTPVHQPSSVLGMVCDSVHASDK
jgi:undecaprenyl diphosphate synthase